MKSNQTPLRSRRVDLDLSPVEAARRCTHLPGLVFFDSALETPATGQVSMLAACPSEVIAGRSGEAWERLAAMVAERQVPDPADCGFPLGFAAGHVAYDGSFCFGFYDDVLIHRHRAGEWTEAGDFLSHMKDGAADARPAQRLEFRSGMTRERFCEWVRRAKDYIAAGDIYQVNLSHQFVSPFRGDPWGFYEALRHYSPAPFAAYIAAEGRSILSSSPELFLRMSGRHAVTRPIKGTRPRRQEPGADEKSAYDLLTSPKEIAELVMITDLERNDLGMVCEFGSVTVRELLRLERYEHVFHLVSEVEGRLRPEVGHVAALRACFPGGSITGAPKKRAREIIGEIEGTPRGLYTGAIGYFGFNGESQFNIAIRTAVIEDGFARFGVGAGIVADSAPEKEYKETLDKAAGILLAAERYGASVGGR